MARLFYACMRDRSPAGPRDAVILALGLAAGLRRAEIVGLALADVDLAGEAVRVVGKGRKVREVPIKGGTLEALRAWLRCRGEEAGPLVCAVRKGGRVEPVGLAPGAVLRVGEKRGREAGLRDFSPHDLRRTYISVLLDRGSGSIDRGGLGGACVAQHDAAVRSEGGAGEACGGGGDRGAVSDAVTRSLVRLNGRQRAERVDGAC